MENTGPKLIIIPEQRYYNCWGCQYYKYEMMQSGLNPIYRSDCMKMNIEGTVLSDEEVKRNIIPFTIDQNGKTPQECPYLKMAERNDKLNNIL